MTTNGGWILVAAALVAGALFGALVGGWSMFEIAKRRFEPRLRHLRDELKLKRSANAEQLRAAQVRAHSELEQLRSSIKRQVAVASEESRAAATRAEERLKAAYAEIDRLRGAGIPTAAVTEAEPTDGFAATRPMREGM
jgi:hypothetical protein